MICALPGCGTVFCDDSDYPPDAKGHPRRYCSRPCMLAALPGWRRRQLERRHGGAEHVPGCVARRKDRYPDKAAAAADVPAKSAQYGVPLAPYDCPDCEFWHLTSSPEDENGEPAWTLADLARRYNKAV